MPHRFPSGALSVTLLLLPPPTAAADQATPDSRPVDDRTAPPASRPADDRTTPPASRPADDRPPSGRLASGDLTGRATLGPDPTYRPYFGDRVHVETPLSAQWSWEDAGRVPIDAAGQALDVAPFTDLVVRAGAVGDLGPSWHPLILRAEVEVDAVAGNVGGGDPGRTDLPDGALLSQGRSEAVVRKANARLGFAPFVTVLGGLTVNHWGLGLVANDGVQSRVVGDAGFVDPRAGDRVLRAQAVFGPFTSQRLLLSLAWDEIREDDVTLPGDRATQASGALVWGHDRSRRAGVYVAHRNQEAEDGDHTRATAVDAYGRHEKRFSPGTLTTELEAAYITGETEMGSTPEHARHDLRQVGGVSRTGWDSGRWGALLDALYASGDSALGDGRQTGFKVDPGFQEGLLLFRHVLAAQTARAPATASDPMLVGYPAEGLDRIPTRGAVTNTWSFHPRLFVRPIGGLTLHGGALFALTDTPLVDPRNSQMAGGAARNALDGTGGRFLGTELSLGAHHQVLLWGTRLTTGVAAALFLPGSAFDGPQGESMSSVSGTRLSVRYEM